MSVISLILLNALAWLLIHLGVSWLAFQIPSAWFNPQSWLYRERSFEARGRLYQKVFRVRAWKRRLPDGARLLGMGFEKKLLSTHPEHLRTFWRETCRSEWAHWVTVALTPLFTLWNPLWTLGILFLYAGLANLPCIVVQRSNRIALAKLLSARKRSR